MTKRRGYIEFLDGSKIDILDIRKITLGDELITTNGLYCMAERTVSCDYLHTSRRLESNYHLYKISIGDRWDHTPVHQTVDFAEYSKSFVPTCVAEEVGFKQVVEYGPWHKVLKLYFKRTHD